MISIVAIISAMAIPRFGNSLVRQRAAAAARRVQADLSLARRVAQSRSSAVTVAFSGAGYSISGLADRNRTASAYAVDLTAEPYRATAVRASFGGAAQVTFDVFGMPSAGGTVQVEVADIDQSVTVDAGSGLARSDADE